MRLRADALEGELRVLFRSDGGADASQTIFSFSKGMPEIVVPPLTAFFCEPLEERPSPARQFILVPDKF